MFWEFLKYLLICYFHCRIAPTWEKQHKELLYIQGKLLFTSKLYALVSAKVCIKL